MAGKTAHSVRLLHVTTVPLTLGFFRGQARYLAQHGVEIHVASSPEPMLADFASEEGVKAHGVPMSRRISPVRDLVSLWRMYRVIRRIRPAILHAHTPKGGLIGLIAAWLARVPLRVYHIHGLPHVTARGWKRTLLVATERVSCSIAHQVYCVSESIRRVADDAAIVAASLTRVIGSGSINGIDIEGRFNPNRVSDVDRAALKESLGLAPGDRVIGFVGRLVRDKGIVELAVAWRQLREEFPDLRLILLGPLEDGDPIPPDIEQQLREDSRVRMLGFVADPARYYSLMDVLALPTYREGFGLVALEAGAFSVPVVATRIPGCIDAVVDGETGTLVPSHDADALSTALRRYIRDPNLRRMHGTAGRHRVLREFRQEIVWEAMCKEYFRLLHKNGLAASPD